MGRRTLEFEEEFCPETERTAVALGERGRGGRGEVRLVIERIVHKERYARKVAQFFRQSERDIPRHGVAHGGFPDLWAQRRSSDRLHRGSPKACRG